jgi:hypothetical protein
MTHIGKIVALTIANADTALYGQPAPLLAMGE